ncbi:uncharacterized protein LOC127009731 isoform X2 [Eriocheir sinensis]|uniref:uncharacterized protein LOC127009731 isoform X2 n=1 Tax=Eriocheir sinensis TaxID=95602 RepID=UPI0021C59C66|nr:uncharacterized protein LOC127009731 isoform X2 [Eriocheir sinensis]
MAGLDNHSQSSTVMNPHAHVFVKCNFCNKDFTKDWSRKRHEKKVHGVNTTDNYEVAEITVPDASKVCTYCNKVFSTSCNKRAHERRQHGVNPGPVSHSDGPTIVQCTECNVTFATLTAYREHLSLVHDIEIHKAQHEFTSEEDFLRWKDCMELDIGVNYTAHSGPKKSCDGTKQIFYCRRSGVQSTKISSKSRAEKSQGTCKMGFYCTSSIEVVKKDEKICVTFYSDHRDHNLDFNSQVHMTLPKSEQDKIAGMITQGIEHDIILDRVRESAGSNRMSFLENKDIDNICVRYGLNKTHSRHSAKPKVSTEEINMIHDVSNEETYDRQVVKYQEQLKNKIMLQLLPKCSESKDLQVLKTANSLLCKLIATLDAGTSYPPNNSNWPVDVTTVSEPGNKKCVKQDRLYSTRKRKRENIGMCLKKPSSKARLIIGESLAKSESDVSVPVLSEGRIDDEHSY